MEACIAIIGIRITTAWSLSGMAAITAAKPS